MSAYIKYILLLTGLFLLTTCKKKPEAIKISVYNPFMNEPLIGADISLREFSDPGTKKNSDPFDDCIEIKNAETDSKGEATIVGASMKNKTSYHYFLIITNAYSTPVLFNCSRTDPSDYLSKTNKAISKKLFFTGDRRDWLIILGNLYSGQFGKYKTDSINVSFYRDFEFVEGYNSELNGSKELAIQFFMTEKIAKNYTFNKDLELFSDGPQYSSEMVYSGKYKVVVYKNKGGVISNETHAEYISPNTKYSFSVNW